MASNGRLSTFDLFCPRPVEMILAQSKSRINGFCVSAAFIAAAASAILPLPILALIVSVSLCLFLIPISPLAMLVLLLALAPLRALIATESGIHLPLDIGQILLALYFGIWLVRGVIKRRPPPGVSREPVLLSAAALCLVFAVGVWTSDGIGNWLSEWLKWVVIAIMIWHLSQSARFDWPWLVFAVLLSAVANAVVGLFIFFGGSGADHLLILGRFFRAFGTFGQPNPFGGFMGIALPIALMCAAVQSYQIMQDLRVGRRVAPARLIALAAMASAAGIVAAALFASWSRGAWLGFAVSLFVMLVALPRRLLKGISLALALGALFFALWSAGLLPRSVVSRITTAATDLFSFSDVRGANFTPTNFAVIERLAHWQAAIGMAQDHPLFGVGLGNYAIRYADYHLINWEAPLGHAHNLYLNFLAETGVLGLAAYLAFWISIFRVTWKTLKHPDRTGRAVAVGLLGCWTYIAVHSVFDNLFVNNLFLHIGVLLAVLAILHRQVAASLKLD